MAEGGPACTLRLQSPLGPLELDLSPGALRAVRFGARVRLTEPPREIRDLHRSVAAQLAEYFAGRRRVFDLPLDPWPAGTPFQRAVWEALKAIPYGEVVAYGDLARWVGRPGGAQAVGQACGANRLPLVLPCHRVVARRGLGGFAGGLAWKKRLLHLEQGCSGK